MVMTDTIPYVKTQFTSKNIMWDFELIQLLLNGLIMKECVEKTLKNTDDMNLENFYVFFILLALLVVS